MGGTIDNNTHFLDYICKEITLHRKDNVFQVYNNCASLGLDVITKRSSWFLATGCDMGKGRGVEGLVHFNYTSQTCACILHRAIDIALNKQ